MTVLSASPTPEQAHELQELLNGPAGKPPEGVVPNFLDPFSLDAIAITTLTLCIVFATLLVWARIYTKIFLMRLIAYEDCKYQSLDLKSQLY